MLGDWDVGTRTWELGLGDVGLGDVELGDVGLGDVGLGDVGLGDMGLGDMGLGDVGLGDVGLGDVGLGDVDAGTRRRAGIRGREKQTTPDICAEFVVYNSRWSREVADDFQRPWFGRICLLACLTVRTLGTE